jgi:hypothetical protein
VSATGHIASGRVIAIRTAGLATITALATETISPAITIALAPTVITAVKALLTETILTLTFTAVAPTVMTTIHAVFTRLVTIAAITAVVTARAPVPSVATLITVSKISRTVMNGTPPGSTRRGPHAGRRMIS